MPALTTAEVMKALNVRSPDTIHAMRRKGKIAGGQIGRQWRFSEESVTAFLAGENARRPFAVRRTPRPTAALKLPPVPDVV